MIEQAAIEIFLEKGYKGTTTREIASRAGVNDVTLFRRYGSKLNILNTIVERKMQMILETLKDIPRNALMADDDGLSQFAAKFLAVSKENIRFILFLVNEGQRIPSISEKIREFPQAVISDLQVALAGTDINRPSNLEDSRFIAILFSSLLIYLPILSSYLDPPVLNDESIIMTKFVGMVQKFLLET